MDSRNTQGADGTTGRGVITEVRDSALSQMSKQKDRATDGLGGLARALRQSTQSLRDGQQVTVARFVEQAADGIEQFSSHLRDRDLRDLMPEVDRLARRQPAVFIGAAFLTGALAVRFLKSSRGDRRSAARSGELGGRSGPSHAWTGGRTGGSWATTEGL